MKQDGLKAVTSVCGLLLGLTLTLILYSPTPWAAVRHIEQAENSTLVETGVLPSQENAKKNPFDGFTWAIVGIALGSFGAIAYLKFSGQKRKGLRDNIEKLSLHVEDTSAVDWEIITERESADPMEGNVNRLTTDFEERVKTLEAKKKALIGETSKVAIEVMRIWG